MLGYGLARQKLIHFVEVLFGVKGYAAPLAAVASRAACLLVVAFEAARHVVVHNEAHVGLVDSHSEGDRRDNHVDLFVQKGVLVAAARAGIESGVVGQG